MNAETEGDAESPKRRGRIPQSAWPRILERYKAGATLSAIAREFDCTPSAISYIVRKAEAAGVTADSGEETPAVMPVVPEPPPAAAADPVRAPRRAAPPAIEPQQEPVVSAPVEPAASATDVAAGRDPLQHESGGRADAPRGEPRRLEGRDNRPPREARENREPRFNPDAPQRSGGAPRFPQGGQRDRFGERRERGPEGRDNRPPREPRDFDRPERQDRIERLPPEIGSQPAEVTYPYRQQQRNPSRLEAQETPTVPADERMDAAAKACAEAYRAWKDQNEGSVQNLGDAIHELRKVIARMEIELSASRKEEQRPIPIPTYRLKQPAPQQPRG